MNIVGIGHHNGKQNHRIYEYKVHLIHIYLQLI